MLIYLASPYSAPTATERQLRYEEVCKYAAQLMQQDEIFCPIAHSHPIETLGMDHMEGHEFWLRQDFAILKHCDKMVVYMLPGWDRSHGVKAEVDFCLRHNIPVEYHQYTNPKIAYLEKGHSRGTQSQAVA